MSTFDLRRVGIAFLAIAVLVPATRSRAQGPDCPLDRVGCYVGPVAFRFREGFLDAFRYDTGWVPPDAPLQVRFAISLGGETEVDLAGSALAFWPRPLEVAVPGMPSGGRFSIDYGVQILASARFDVEVAGIRYAWEGDIPLGSVPRDLRTADERRFDSMLLPPQVPRPVELSDSTERIRVLETDVAGLIGISGVGGGFALEVEARLGAAYATDRIEIRDAVEPIRIEAASTVVRPGFGEAAWGAGRNVVIGPVGQLDYDGLITLYPSFFVEILGRRFDAPVAAIEVPVVMLRREVRFDPVAVHVPLPDARIAPRDVDFGAVEVGRVVSALLEIRSEGEAELAVTPRRTGSPFEVMTTSLSIPPRTTRRLEVTFAPDAPGTASAMLFLETNDPDQPLVVVRLVGSAFDRSLLDAGVRGDGGGGPDAGTGGGCACRAAASGSDAPASTMACAAAVALALRARRRRAARRQPSEATASAMRARPSTMWSRDAAKDKRT
jgi:hypothetical protein